MTVSTNCKGETVVATLQNENTNLTQGFHQPLMIDLFPTRSLEDDMVLDMVEYPNPTYDKKVLFTAVGRRSRLGNVPLGSNAGLVSIDAIGKANNS